MSYKHKVAGMTFTVLYVDFLDSYKSKQIAVSDTNTCINKLIFLIDLSAKRYILIYLTKRYPNEVKRHIV